MLWIRIATVFAIIMTASAAAHAKDVRMIILIDASGSMIAATADGTRFDSAKLAELGDIATITGPLLPSDTFQAAVYTFTCNFRPCLASEPMLIRHTGADDAHPFVSKSGAIAAINCLSVTSNCLTNAPDLGGSTPLAGGMCSTLSTLTTSFPDPATVKILSVSSDGLENATTNPPCNQDPDVPFFTGNRPPTGYPTGTWQLKTVTAFNAVPLEPIQHVFIFKLDFSLAAPTVQDPEAAFTPAAGLSAPTLSASATLDPLVEFFTILTQASGGTLNVIPDGQPLPVPGDLNNDRCVDRADAIAVARHFGPLVPPVDGRFDVNLDRTVNFTDYEIQVGHITPACGPDPYVRGDVVACRGSDRVVIDGQAIEDGGLTIDARGSCEITIKNSLIVSGKNAIKIVGSVKIIVDNSIVVGQDALIVQNGAGVLSAANSVFHGKLNTLGSFQYIDRGGNVFE